MCVHTRICVCECVCLCVCARVNVSVCVCFTLQVLTPVTHVWAHLLAFIQLIVALWLAVVANYYESEVVISGQKKAYGRVRAGFCVLV